MRLTPIPSVRADEYPPEHTDLPRPGVVRRGSGSPRDEPHAHLGVAVQVPGLGGVRELVWLGVEAVHAIEQLNPDLVFLME